MSTAQTLAAQFADRVNLRSYLADLADEADLLNAESVAAGGPAYAEPVQSWQEFYNDSEYVPTFAAEFKRAARAGVERGFVEALKPIVEREIAAVLATRKQAA